MVAPVVWLMVVGVGAGMLSTGFLMPEIGWFNLQGVSVNERDFSAPLDHVNVDIEVSKKLGIDADGSFFKNFINACSFHTPDPGGLGPGATVICKLTDKHDDVVAEGRLNLPNGLDKSERTLVPIQQTAFFLANEIQNVNDIKLVVLGGNPTSELCAMLAFDTCVDFDGIATPTRGISALTTEAFLTAPLTSWFPGALNGLEGIAFHDFNGNGLYDLSMDALVNEGVSCPTSFEDGFYNAPGGVNAPQVDCVIVDVSNMLTDLRPTECHLPFLIDVANGFIACTSGFELAFFDANGNGVYDDGEDIFIDSSLGGVPDGILA